MKRTALGFLIFGLIAVLLFPPCSYSQENVAQKKAMARRSAIGDAQRTLSEIINGIYIDSETTIRDFIVENDTIRANLEGFIRAAEVMTENYVDEIYTVTLQIDVEKLKKLIGKKFDYDVPFVEAVGRGAAPGEKKAKIEPSPAVSQEPEKEWYEQVLQVKGYGAMPNELSYTAAQKKLMAERAAKDDAYRNLIELIKGVRVTSNTTIQDFITVDDTILTNIKAFVRGARVVRSVLLNDGRHEVTIEANLLPLKTIIE